MRMRQIGSEGRSEGMRGLLWLVAAMSLRPTHAIPQPYAHYTYESWNAIDNV